MQNQSIKLSICIPTLHRAQLLELTLDSILRQKCIHDLFEVIVIDNSKEGDIDTVHLCKDPKYNRLSIDCIHHPIKGASEARNRAISESHGDLIGFIDADEKLPDNWICKVFEIFQNKEPDIFGGGYKPFFLEPQPEWFKTSYHEMFADRYAKYIFPQNNQYLLGGNMIFKRKVFSKMIGFNVKFGPGTGLSYGDETELQNRANEAGINIYFDPELYIYHYVPPTRMKVKWFIKSRWKHGKAKATLYMLYEGRKKTIPIKAFLSSFPQLTKNCCKLLLSSIKLIFRDRQRFPHIQNFIIEVMVPIISGFSTSWHVMLATFKNMFD